MKRMLSRLASCMIAALLLAILAGAAYAEFHYTPIDIVVPVGGTGTFYLKEVGADESTALKETFDGYGEFTLTIDEPDNYYYEVYSKDELNTAVYDVEIGVFAVENDVLEAHMVITERESGDKVPSAYYPIVVENPPIVKTLSGETAPAKETFVFVFRAVETSVTELKGKMPMPKGSTGQTKTVTVVGAGQSEAGEIIFSKPGTYVYSFEEKAGNVAGYTYDKTVYRVTMTVTATEKGLVCETTMTKNNAPTTDMRAVFVNDYHRPPSPKTGDLNNVTLWVCVFGASLLVCAALFFVLRRRKKNKAD